MATNNLGRIAILHKGAWSGATAYAALDCVYLNGRSYLAILPGTNKNPETETLYWQLMADIGGQDLLDDAVAARDAAEDSASAAAASAAQLASGVASPAGTYANLAALIAEDPDHSKIYITLDNGKWCYHNGAAWVAGGTYQAAALDQDIVFNAINTDNPWDTVSLTNVVTNGDFSNGTTDWYSMYATSFTAAGNIASAVGDGSAVYAPQIARNIYGLYASGKELYVQAQARFVDGGSVTKINIMLTTPGMTTITETAVTYPVEDEWYNISEVITLGAGGVPGANMGLFFNLIHSSAGAATSELQLKNVVVIDLTGVWISGNYPTQWRMLEILSNNYTGGFFDGTADVNNSIYTVPMIPVVQDGQIKYSTIGDVIGGVKVVLPNEYHCVVGDTFQLFYRGLLEVVNPYDYDIRVRYDGSNAKAFPRYMELVPEVGDIGTHNLGIYVAHTGVLLGSDTCTVVVNAVPSSPAANVNILCIGDSITAEGTWVTETYRRLTGSGGTPAGDELTNITFIGTVGTTPKYEGYGGWSWVDYLAVGSPFWYGGKVDFQAYCTDHSFTGIDYAYIDLSWNYQQPDMNTVLSNAATVASAKEFIDILHAQYPNAKVRLMGLQLPSLNGGMGENYGANGGYADTYGYVRTVLGLNLAYQALANEAAYSSFVEFVNLSGQFDSENNMPESDVAVNTRNAKTEKRGTNGVHPATEGYMQIADAAYRKIIDDLQ